MHGGVTPLSGARALPLSAFVRHNTAAPRRGQETATPCTMMAFRPDYPVSLRVGTANVGSMKGRSAEVADMLDRRRIDVCGFQEVRFNGEGTRIMKGAGSRYKWFWKGSGGRQNGVGIAVKEELAKAVLGINRVSDRMMELKLTIGDSLVSFVVVYVPQVGLSQAEKDSFYDELYGLRGRIKNRCVILGDWNGHVGAVKDGFRSHGGYGYGVKNAEGDAILEFAEGSGMVVANTCFEREESKLVTYKSGELATQVDYIMIDEADRGRMRNCKVIPGEEVLSEHRLLVMDWAVGPARQRKGNRGKGRLKIWKLRSVECKNRFAILVDDVSIEGETAAEKWTCLEKGLTEAAGKVCGRSKGCGRRRETWWWDDQVGKVLETKKTAYKKWQKEGGDENRVRYKELKKEARMEVAKAIKRHAERHIEECNREGMSRVYKWAKQWKKEGKDIVGIPCVKNKRGELKVQVEERVEVWREYCESLMNIENEWDGVVYAEQVMGPWEEVTVEEVRAAWKKMKNGRAAGPSEVYTEMLGERKCLKVIGEVVNELLAGGKLPESWKNSLVVPLFKGKGEATECGNYRTIKLMEHAMKLAERVLEARIRRVVDVSEEQYGFRPGRGTTDAAFVVRQLQEKYLEKRKELFMVFIDLEKAFDRVPRKVIEYALRKKGVAECMVRAVMQMYKEASAVVADDGVWSGRFEVGVGVHQGSVLSPLLFICVLDVLTDGVRGLCRSLMYADDVVLIGESMEEVMGTYEEWKRVLEAKGLKVNVAKTKGMRVSREVEVKDFGKWPCGVCGRNVGVNSIKCERCSKWVHSRCSGIRGSLSRIRDFVCKTCLRGGRVQMENFERNGLVLEGVEEFKYLGDVLNNGGGCMRAVMGRVQAAWMSFKELGGLLCGNKLGLKQKGRLYKGCIRSVLGYGAEIWTTGVKELNKLVSTERKMLRMMCGITLKDKVTNVEVAERVGVESLEVWLRRQRLRWYGHVLRKGDHTAVGRMLTMEVAGSRGRGRPMRRWIDVVERDMRVMGLEREMAGDREIWRRGIHGPVNPR